MARKPKLDIVAGKTFTTASVRGEVLAVKWGPADGGWYLAVAGKVPQRYGSEKDVTNAFLRSVLEPEEVSEP